MQSARSDRLPTPALRYSLGALFEYVTICAGICALIPLIGPWSAVCLMLTGLAIAAGEGALALAGLTIAVVFHPLVDSISVGGQLLTMAAAAGMAFWFRWRYPLEPSS